MVVRDCVEIVADHQSVRIVVLRELLPDRRKVARVALECLLAPQLMSVGLGILIEHHEEEPTEM